MSPSPAFTAPALPPSCSRVPALTYWVAERTVVRLDFTRWVRTRRSPTCPFCRFRVGLRSLQQCSRAIPQFLSPHNVTQPIQPRNGARVGFRQHVTRGVVSTFWRTSTLRRRRRPAPLPPPPSCLQFSDKITPSHIRVHPFSCALSIATRR